MHCPAKWTFFRVLAHCEMLAGAAGCNGIDDEADSGFIEKVLLS